MNDLVSFFLRPLIFSFTVLSSLVRVFHFLGENGGVGQPWSHLASHDSSEASSDALGKPQPKHPKCQNIKGIRSASLVGAKSEGVQLDLVDVNLVDLDLDDKGVSLATLCIGPSCYWWVQERTLLNLVVSLHDQCSWQNVVDS